MKAGDKDRVRAASDDEEEDSNQASQEEHEEAGEEEEENPAFEGEQGLGKDGVWNIQSYIDRKLVQCTLANTPFMLFCQDKRLEHKLEHKASKDLDPTELFAWWQGLNDEERKPWAEKAEQSKPICVRVDLCLGNERSTVIRIEGKCSNLVVTKCCNIVLMVDEIAAACTISESELVSIVVRGTFPSPLTIRGVNGICLTCGQNNVHSSVSVSRGIGVEIHGIVKAGQLEPPFSQVSKRMPIDVWEVEALLKASEGKTVLKVPPDGVFVVQCCRITKCADILNRECLTGEPVLMWHEDWRDPHGKPETSPIKVKRTNKVQAPALNWLQSAAAFVHGRDLPPVPPPQSAKSAQADSDTTSGRKWYGLGINPSVWRSTNALSNAKLSLEGQKFSEGVAYGNQDGEGGSKFSGELKGGPLDAFYQGVTGVCCEPDADIEKGMREEHTERLGIAYTALGHVLLDAQVDPLAVSSQGDFSKAIKNYGQRLAIAKEVGDRAGEGRAYRNLGWT